MAIDRVSTVYTGIKKTIADPTDVNNRDAAIGGTVAAGAGSAVAVGGAKYGAKGADVVASKLKTMRQIAVSGQQTIMQAGALKKQNLNMLYKMAGSVIKFFEHSKSMQWVARMMNTNIAKKVGGAAGGLLALGITGAQLYSAGDMAVESITTYKK